MWFVKSTFAAMPPQKRITATARDLGGNSSEFSAPRLVTAS
jgi:hypothetical protein